MAIITSSPGGSRTSSITPAPSYSGVVAKYASEISSALNEQSNAKTANLVTSWRAGEMSWEDFLSQYQALIDASPSDSTRRATLKNNLLTYKSEHTDSVIEQRRSELREQYSAGGTLTKQDEYNIERQILSFYDTGTDEYNSQSEKIQNLYQSAVQEMVDNKEAELLTKFSGGGVTSQEKLNIVNELMKLAPVGTEAYNNLVSQRISVMDTMQSEGIAQNKDKATQAFELAAYQDANEILPGYEAGKMDGLTADQTSLDNWKNVQTLMEGIKGQVEGKTIAYINSKVTDLENRLRDRQSGKVFDAYVPDNTGNMTVQPINVLDITSGINTGAVAPKIDFDANDNTYKVYDPRSGNYVAQAASKSVAEQQARALKVPGVINVKTPNGVDTYYYDSNAKSVTYNDFVHLNAETGKADGAYPTIPTNDTQAQFKVPIADDQISREVNPTYGSELTKGVDKKNILTYGKVPLNFLGLVGKGLNQVGQDLTPNSIKESKDLPSRMKSSFDLTAPGMLINSLSSLINRKGTADNPALAKTSFGSQNNNNQTQQTSSNKGSSGGFNIFNSIGNLFNKAKSAVKGAFT